MKPGTRGAATGRATGPARQRGMSMTGVMAIMGVSIFLGLFAIKAGPSYMENMTVQTIVGDTAENADLMRSSRTKVYQQLNAQYRMNNLWDLKAEDTIVLTKAKSGYVMNVAYEKRENLFANIDLVMRFDDTAGDDER